MSFEGEAAADHAAPANRTRPAFGETAATSLRIPHQHTPADEAAASDASGRNRNQHRQQEGKMHIGPGKFTWRDRTVFTRVIFANNVQPHSNGEK